MGQSSGMDGTDRASSQAEIERLRHERDSAEAASRARASFLATVSHEIREPMNSVLGMARLLRDTPLDAEQRGYLDAVIDAGEALLTLVNDVLDLSRIDAGKLELDETDFALAPFLDRLRALIEPAALRRGLKLRIEVERGTPPLLHTDPGRLRQVLINLAVNAIKFTEQGGITIRVAPEEAAEGRVGLRIAVEDTGPGIAEAALRRLFEAYGQADRHVVRLYGGSGLGLVIANRLMHALGGAITVRSRESVGTTFEIRLALAPPRPQTRSASAAAAPLAGASLLVVDPQERTRSGIVELAAGWGLTARAARFAGQALAILDDAADRGRPFDLVLIDRDLSDLPGEQLGRRVMAEPRYARPGLILLAASGLRGDAAQAREAGFSAYLPKPVTAEMLLRCLQTLRAAGPERQAGLITVHTMADRQERLEVLVADDNDVNRRLMQILLERAGHRPTIVCNGLEAVQALEKRPFDVVLMDVLMPTLDGLEAIRRIRALKDPTRAATPIIAVTANAMRGDAASCFAAGMDGYVTKPITMASLSEAMSRHAKPRVPPAGLAAATLAG